MMADGGNPYSAARLRLPAARAEVASFLLGRGDRREAIFVRTAK
jgi:hypothetical protein